jgi:hypothetical protein
MACLPALKENCTTKLYSYSKHRFNEVWEHNVVNFKECQHT